MSDMKVPFDVFYSKDGERLSPLRMEVPLYFNDPMNNQEQNALKKAETLKYVEKAVLNKAHEIFGENFKDVDVDIRPNISDIDVDGFAEHVVGDLVDVLAMPDPSGPDWDRYVEEEIVTGNEARKTEQYYEDLENVKKAVIFHCSQRPDYFPEYANMKLDGPYNELVKNEIEYTIGHYRDTERAVIEANEKIRDILHKSDQSQTKQSGVTANPNHWKIIIYDKAAKREKQVVVRDVPKKKLKQFLTERAKTEAIKFGFKKSEDLIIHLRKWQPTQEVGISNDRDKVPDLF